MKKIIISAIGLVIFALIMFSGIMPGKLKCGEAERFHPHTDELGGANDVSNMLKYLADGSLPFTGWTSAGRNVIAFSFKGMRVIGIWGTGNPTIFPTTQSYIDQQVSGMDPVRSIKGIDSMKSDLGCLGDSYAGASIPISIPVSVSAIVLGVIGVITLGKMSGRHTPSFA